MLAIAALHEQSVGSTKDFGPPQAFSLAQYNKAISHLRGRILEGECQHVILLTCVLFICLEFIRGNSELALGHLQSGLRILSLPNSHKASSIGFNRPKP